MPEMCDEEDLVFRPLVAADLPQLHRWVSAPHARRWFGGERSFDELAGEYGPVIDGRVPIRAFVVIAGRRPIGMVEWVRVGDFPHFQQACGVEDPRTANCDVVIGEEDVVGRGFGPRLVRAFLDRVIFADPAVPACVIDPEPGNAIAIRAYEKAGFGFVRALPDDGEGNGVYLMSVGRDQPADAVVSLVNVGDGLYVRPARQHELGVAVDIDDDSWTLLVERDARFALDLADDDPFVVAEMARWAEAARDTRLLFACGPTGEPVGFAALGVIDAHPHLLQLSVRRAWSRRGIGRALLERAVRWSVREGELWLTTYRSVPWNAPWYQRQGFTPADPSEIGPQLQAILRNERVALPDVDERVAMIYRLRSKTWRTSRL